MELDFCIFIHLDRLKQIHLFNYKKLPKILIVIAIFRRPYIIHVYLNIINYNDENIHVKTYLSRRMGKLTICVGENKSADQLRSSCEADQHLCFRYTDTTVLHFLYFLNLEFSGSSHLLRLYSPVCVGPVRNPNCWFSRAQTHLIVYITAQHGPAV